MGLELGRWCKFHKVKGYHTKDFYQLKKEIECLIQEGHLKKYIKGDSSQGSGGTNSRSRDDTRNPGPIKGNEQSKEA